MAGFAAPFRGGRAARSGRRFECELLAAWTGELREMRMPGIHLKKKKANGGILEGKREEKERLSPGKHAASRQENGKACESSSSSSLFLLQKEEEP